MGKKMNKAKFRIGRALRVMVLAILSCLSMSACALFGSRDYYYRFGFDTHGDANTYGHPDVDVLDWVYGDGKIEYLRFSDYHKEMGMPEPGTSVYGPLPRAESLYVKWRVRADGSIHEDRVDLRGLLPANPTGYTVHFVADGKTLYVFLVPPSIGAWDNVVWKKPNLRAKYEIYPNHYGQNND